MKTLKKQYQLFQLNRRISGLNSMLMNEQFASAYNGTERLRETEKSYLIRESINDLQADKEALKAK